MGFKLGKRSIDNLKGVHPDLVRVVHKAIEITDQDFSVIQGLRSKSEQLKKVKDGVSWTTKSRHLTGHAVDVVPYPIDWDSIDKFLKIKDAFFRSAEILGIPIRWGGDWNGNGDYKDEIHRGTYDGGHFELPRSTRYP